MNVRHLQLFIVFVFIFGALHGESEMRMRGLENRIDTLEKNNPSSTNINALTPCAGPRVKNGMDLFISADFIYWTMRLDTLTYAKTGHGNLSPATGSKKGEVQSVNWTWDPGFKAALGWNFCHGCWDMSVQYTWLYTNVSDTKHSTAITPSYDILPPSLMADEINFTRAHAHFDHHFQVGDLELGRNYYVSKALKVRPFIGLKGTWQKESYNVYYDDTNIESLPIESYNFKTRLGQSVWGLGMRGGLNTSWQFSKYVGLYGNLAFSGIWLHYDLDRKDTFETVEENPQIHTVVIPTFNIQDQLRLIKPVLEFGIGLRVESYFACNRYHILLQGGWESQIWINQSLQIAKQGHYNRFDLSLHGLTAKLRFDF
ncbi:MAG: hypothetical protein KDK71_08975 [Chlamydiia bacterium]|nr:hypothetical protein [Chlamydiia bacterium]